MADTSAIRVVRDARREAAPVDMTSDPRLHVQIAIRQAKVILLPGRFRDAAYVRRHVEFVLTRPAEQGEQHVRRNLSALRKNLEDMGVDQIAIDVEVRRVEAAVRAEIWKQVLLPGGDE
ncbi:MULTISPECIES: DUF6074 family protein [unclassified Bradyrhizobium]|uniref:DUF6074 family protein n=1 Tax=unclassified Bradyrhizobium TaxID=2631580 RepID=UPI001FFA41C4|nr:MULTISPECIES: DUF6074 family protein [unclassified Bradyrhizobium]MCK1474904.1 hypothetical protein [Bradyrhizobium sp. 197]MCK1656054.1 hypothetical protein [Bradyrhizobium sp. 151]UPJ57653.1 hypothetical protein IVB24_34740 [Bradyrhizobium sp. 192]